MAANLIGERSQDRERVVTDGEVRYRRVLIVETDNPEVGPKAVSEAEGVPKRLDVYRVKRDDGSTSEEDTSCRLVEKRAEPAANSKTLWYVECVYSDAHDDPESSENGDSSDDPEDDPPEVSVGYEIKMKACTATPGLQSMDPAKIQNGKGCITTAGEPFDPPVEYEVCLTTLSITISKVVLNFNNEVLTFQNTINMTAFLGAGIQTLRLRITANRIYRKGLRYWRINYTFTHDPDTWILKVLNAGTYYRDAADDNKIKHFVTEDDPPQPRIGLIAENGDKLHPADDPHYVEIMVNTEVEFGNLNLPLGAL